MRRFAQVLSRLVDHLPVQRPLRAPVGVWPEGEESRQDAGGAQVSFRRQRAVWCQRMRSIARREASGRRGEAKQQARGQGQRVGYR